MAIDVEKIHKPIRKLKKFTAKLPSNASPEKIHKLRTNARKLESTFSALSLDSAKNERRLIKEVRKIRKRAGKVRDLDVLTGDLATIHVDGESECQVQLLEHLGAKRQKQTRKLRKLISRQRADMKHRLRKASTTVDKVLKNKELQPGSVAAAESLGLSSELGTPRRFSKSNLHPYRLKVKQLRYVLELSPDHPKFANDLGEVKDAIGDWHDWEELVAIADDVLDHGAKCKLTRRIKAIADSKFDHAARVADRLRNKYVKNVTRDHKKRHGGGLSVAAVAASAALSEDAGQAA
ncbi:MAG TPA: CHAD domain-containing protein [Terriglobales bacterium]|jgi:CHAD domain-containing protein|nr:CHAD domain-containing protein [Terriglobales bacterium]